jgi:CubicO group peptidase (beta-lactamase class C family)
MEETLQEQLDSLTEMMHSSLKNIPGIAISIVVDEEILFSKTAGVIGVIPSAEKLVGVIKRSEREAICQQTEIENPPPSVDAEKTAFLIASITKTFLAMICLQCQERGELDLDTDINIYLSRGERYPVIQVNNPHFPDDPITIRQLLTHSAGLQDDESALESGSYWRNNSGDSPHTLYDYVSTRLVPSGKRYNRSLWDKYTPPGNSEYHYSNAGFTLLAFVIEQVMHMSLNELAHRDIFTPLDMTNTDYFLSYFQPSTAVNIAIPHLTRYLPITHYGVTEWPACQIRTTLQDLTRYLLSFTSSSAEESSTIPPLLSNASKAMLLPSDMKKGLAWWGKDTSYGDRRGRYWGHGGFMEGVRTHIVYFPPLPPELTDEGAAGNAVSAQSIKRKGRGAIILTNGSFSYDHMLSKITNILLPK